MNEYDDFSKRSHVLDVLSFLIQKKKAGEPASLIRLGDGEGRLLGYPEIVEKTSDNADCLDHSLQIWFGKTDFSKSILVDLSLQLREAVKNADVVGLPTSKQCKKASVYYYVLQAVSRFSLLGNNQIITDAAIHRYLQFGLFYNELLNDSDFVGLVTGRPQLARILKDTFNINEVRDYLIPAEAIYPSAVVGEHYPECFFSIKKELQIPYSGAIFLVGAGALGKIYCNWIKSQGGIAIDIGSICDSWSNEGRLQHDYHKIQHYQNLEKLSSIDLIGRYNTACSYFKLNAAYIEKSEF